MDPSDLVDPEAGALSLQDLQNAGLFAKGVGKGAWGTVKAAAQTPFDVWDLAYHPESSDLGAGAAQAVTHPVDTATGIASNLYQGLTGGPESAGETLGGFITPGDLAKGLSALKDVGQVSRSEIWAGRGSPLYDTERSAIAREMKRRGGYTDREIYDATFDPRTGGGYWVPPENMQPPGAPAAWAWVSDKEAGLQPGAMAEIRAEAQRQMNATGLGDQRPGKLTQGQYSYLMTRGEKGELPRTQYTLSDFMRPEWKGFEAYPGLRDMPVTLDPFSNAFGGWTPSKGQMELGGFFRGPAKAGATKEELLDSLMHEPSHAIQQFESMPMGSSPEAMGRLHKALSYGLEDIVPGVSQRVPYLDDRQLLRTSQEALERAGGNPVSHGYDPRFAAYLNVAGEANARLPNTVRNLEAARESEQIGKGLPPNTAPQVYPFEHYADTGPRGTVLSDPTQQLVTGKGGRLLVPSLQQRVHLEPYGLTGELQRPNPNVNLGRGQMREQLALGLRRAPRRAAGPSSEAPPPP